MSIIPNSEARSFYGSLLTARAPFAFIYHCESGNRASRLRVSRLPKSFSASSLSSRDRTRINPSSRYAPRLIEIGQINRLRTDRVQRPLGSATLYILVYSTRIRAQQPLPKSKMSSSSSSSPSHTYIFFALYIHVPFTCQIFFAARGHERSLQRTLRFRVIWNNNIFVIHGYNVKNVPCEVRVVSQTIAAVEPIKEAATRARWFRRIIAFILRRGEEITKPSIKMGVAISTTQFDSGGKNGLWHRAETDLYLATADLVSRELNR